MRIWLMLLLPVLTVAAVAQQVSAGKSTNGTVIGHVYCADTNAPARMASVQLESVSDADQRSTGKPHLGSGMPTAGGLDQTGFDGSFTLTDVPPGSYYVVVNAAGYLSPRARGEDIDNAEPQPAQGQPPLVIPKVDVEADQTANIDIRLERGAAVSGTVRFDDGSPAAGVQFLLLHKSKDKWIPSSPSHSWNMRGMESTDDLGHYRISGLRDREYILKIMLTHTGMISTGTHGFGLIGGEHSVLMIYSGGVTRIKDAVPFKLGAGEERTGEDIIIPLSKFHSISGVVTAARDGHAISGGSLEVTDPDDKNTIAMAELGRDGTFHLEGIPEGSYLLQVQNARDKAMQEVAEGHLTLLNEKVFHTYGDLEQTIKVESDIPNLVLAVPEPKSSAATASQ